MKVIKICIFVTFMTFSVSLMAGNYTPALSNGYPADQLDAVRDKAIAIAHMDQAAGLKPLSAITITNLGSGDVYYALFSNIQIRAFNLAENTYLGGWPIKRSKDEYIEPDFLDRVNSFQRGLDLGWAESDATDSLGCLGAYPLRYGDIDGDGHSELLLFLNDDFLVFSLASHQIVFSAPLKLDDWLDTTESQTFITQLGEAGGAVPQYQSRIAAESLARMQVVLPGQRGYAKLYLGDFNGDGKFDIVVWRKFYVSLMQSDTTKGFKLVSDTYLLYSLENGVYTKQSTDQAAIKGWLAAKTLTWQAGYPQTSECTGQTGKPIPEMVGPLLNDPDVLK